MKIGKLPNSLLNKIVLDPINKYSIDREEVLVKPSIGEDCSALTIPMILLPVVASLLV